jgi:SET domain-containing protein
MNNKIYNRDSIAMKIFFKFLGLQYCPFLLFDTQDFAIKKILQNKIKLVKKDKDNDESYANLICYKWQKETRKPQLYILYVNDEIGYGLFADQNFCIDDFVGEYCGTVTSKYTEISHCYNVNYYDNNSNVIIAPRKIGNELQFANHSKDANVKWQTIVGNDNKYHIIFVAIKNISENEQILVDYGDKYWEALKIEAKIL